MPVYEYVGILSSGKKTKGTLEGDSPRSVRQRLKQQGVYVTDLKADSKDEAGSTNSAGVNTQNVLQFLKRGDSVPLRELSIATRQLSTLVGAGLPLVEGLSALADQTPNQTFRRIIIEVKEKVEEGSSLAKALVQFPKAFPPLFINMVASGEESGTLEAVLENLSDYFEAQMELRRKVTSAMFYPILMFGFCTLVVTLLVAFVVPNIAQIFEKQGGVLPLPTRILLGLSYFITHYWFLIIGFVILVMACTRAWYKTPNGRAIFDRFFLNAPIYGNISTKIATARVARTLGTLLSSGVNLLTALDISKNIVSNTHIAKALSDAREGVQQGKSLAGEISKSGLFPPMLFQMIAVGERSGQLEPMLNRAAKSFENEANAALAGLTSLIEPLMIIGLGGSVFCIVLAVLMPMMNLMDLVQK